MLIGGDRELDPEFVPTFNNKDGEVLAKKDKVEIKARVCPESKTSLHR